MRKLFLFFLALLLPFSLQAQEKEKIPPSFVIIGSLVTMQVLTKNVDTCKEDPCNAIAHVVGGGILGAYLRKEYGAETAFWTVLAIGIGKELMDQNFDAKDALMTGLGGLLSVSYEF